MTEPIHDVAHIGPVELLTPEPERSLASSSTCSGMEIEAEAGGSVYLRGWGTYQRYDLKLTAATAERPRCTWGCAPGARRRSQRRVEAIERSGLGLGWTDGDLGAGLHTASPIRTGTRWRSTTRPSGTSRRPHLRPR